MGTFNLAREKVFKMKLSKHQKEIKLSRYQKGQTTNTFLGDRVTPNKNVNKDIQEDHEQEEVELWEPSPYTDTITYKNKVGDVDGEGYASGIETDAPIDKPGE